MFFFLRIVAALLLIAAAQEQKPQPSGQGTEPEKPGLCEKAVTQLELNQCTAEQYKVVDARLNTLYQQINADLGRGKDTLAVGKLKAAQQAWINYRDLHCDAARHQFEGGSMAPMIFSDCLTGVTLNRIQELKFAYPVHGWPRE
ncbi:MAG TPA: lysozyme inhibitor LprI family protein [Candidatus Angelobacter sp.]|nr:lysozyme inhibitor LprI family protein [Candidatus Angelobacter sp.]